MENYCWHFKITLHMNFFSFLNIEISECIICDSGDLGDGSPDSMVATVAATFIISVVDFLNFVV